MNQKDITCDKILDSARKLFGHFGFKKTTMDDIAHDMGKGKSSLYYYFKSKEEVYKAVVSREIMVMESFIQKKIQAEATAKGQLTAFVEGRFNAIERVTLMYDALKSDYLGQYRFIDQIRKKHHRQEIEVVKRILDKGMSEESFSIADSKLTAIGIVTALKGIEIPMFTGEHDQDYINERIDAILHIIFNGILKK